MLKVRLTSGSFFICDEVDEEIARRYSWSLSNGYATSWIRIKNVLQHKTFHRILLGDAPSGFQWDHIDRDKLHNCRSNLRLVTRSQNIHNSKVRNDNTSGIRGVSWNNRYGWLARIMVSGSSVHLGYFKKREEAAVARRAAELAYFPEIYGEN